MKCWACGIYETENFDTWCRSCNEDAERRAQAEQARKKLFRYRGAQYSDACQSCQRKETVLWIVALPSRKSSIGGDEKVVGTWCDGCIQEMVESDEREADQTFEGKSILFLKKCYAPPFTQAMKEVCDVLTSLDF